MIKTVHLPQLKRYCNQYRNQFLLQLKAFSLLMLFINALIIQGLHHHHDADLLSHHSCEVKVGEELKYVDGAKLECKICEVIKQQSHFYHLPDAVVSIIFQENRQQSVTAFLPQHSSRYLLAAANKGPPEANA